VTRRKVVKSEEREVDKGVQSGYPEEVQYQKRLPDPVTPANGKRTGIPVRARRLSKCGEVRLLSVDSPIGCAVPPAPSDKRKAQGNDRVTKMAVMATSLEKKFNVACSKQDSNQRRIAYTDHSWSMGHQRSVKRVWSMKLIRSRAYKKQNPRL
jgi:hypothetical protein